MDPLSGYYTTPEIADAINDFNKSDPIPNWLSQYMKVNAFVKYGKTVLSPQTHVRNYLSNYGFHLANGRVFNGRKEWLKSHKDVFKLYEKRNPEYRERIKKLYDLGVIGESTKSREIQDVMRDTTQDDVDFSTRSDSMYKKIKRSTLKWINKAYQVEDDVHKIYAFEFEKDSYKQAFKRKYPNKSEKEIETMAEEKAAQVVRSTMPTYSLVPKGIQKMRRFPVVGTFVSFPWEVIRTSFNTLDLVSKEWQDPDTRKIAARRSAGLLAASIIPAAAAWWSKYKLGISEEEDEDVRRFVAPWSKNSDFIYLSDGEGKGKYAYIDLSYSDPHAMIKKPLLMILKGASNNDVKKSALEALEEFTSPFLSEEILFKRLMEIRANKKESGAPVYNEELDLGDKMIAWQKYLWKGIEPGAITSGRRISKAFQEQSEEEGRVYNPTDEIMAVVTGQRRSAADIEKSFGFKTFRGMKRISEARRIYTKALYDKKMSEADKLKAYEQSANSLNKIFEELNKDYRAAMRLGVPQEKLWRNIDQMRDEKIRASNAIKNGILTGKFTLNKYDGKIY